MGRRGTKPKTTSLKILSGTQPCRINPVEPRPEPSRPDPPDNLTGEALAEWNRIVPVLMALGVITQADGFALGIYCVAYARWVEAREVVARVGMFLDTTTIRTRELDAKGHVVEVETPNPKGCIKSNPAVAVAASCETTMARILGSFGLTPADRSRVKSRCEVEKPADALSLFLKRREGP